MLGLWTVRMLYGQRKRCHRRLLTTEILAIEIPNIGTLCGSHPLGGNANAPYDNGLSLCLPCFFVLCHTSCVCVCCFLVFSWFACFVWVLFGFGCLCDFVLLLYLSLFCVWGLFVLFCSIHGPFLDPCAGGCGSCAMCRAECAYAYLSKSTNTHSVGTSTDMFVIWLCCINRFEYSPTMTCCMRRPSCHRIFATGMQLSGVGCREMLFVLASWPPISSSNLATFVSFSSFNVLGLHDILIVWSLFVGWKLGCCSLVPSHRSLDLVSSNLGNVGKVFLLDFVVFCECHKSLMVCPLGLGHEIRECNPFVIFFAVVKRSETEGSVLLVSQILSLALCHGPPCRWIVNELLEEMNKLWMKESEMTSSMSVCGGGYCMVSHGVSMIQ